MKWKIGVPSARRKRLVPSGMRPCPCVPRIRGQRLVLGERQKMQSGSSAAGEMRILSGWDANRCRGEVGLRQSACGVRWDGMGCAVGWEEVCGGMP